MAKTPSESGEGVRVTQERHADGSKGCREPVPARGGHLAGPFQPCAYDDWDFVGLVSLLAALPTSALLSTLWGNEIKALLQGWLSG